MTKGTQYLIDKNGNKISVIIPYKDWKGLNDDYIKLKQKLNILLGITNGFNEIKLACKSGKKLQTLESFLREF